MEAAEFLNRAQTSEPPPDIDTVEPDFYLARQPILDRHQNLVAYELLFRDANVDSAFVTSDLSATAAVISHASQLGLESVIGNSLGFLNVDAAVLMNDIFQFLPREKIILEILETTKVTPEILMRISELAQSGFRFALDDVVADSPDVRALLPLVEIIKFDLKDIEDKTFSILAPQFKHLNKKLLAEKVETQEQFKHCLDLGCDYFQGYYFAKPLVLNGSQLSPSQIAITKLMALVMSDAENEKIEEAVKADASIGLNLLLLANSVAMGARERIKSLAQALVILGRNQLQRWLQILLYAEPSRKEHGAMPLLMLATTRGRLLELISEKVQPNQRGAADMAFTVGIMSLMDTLFHMPMEQILEKIAVVDAVREALLFRKGVYGQMLKLVEYIEYMDLAGSLLAPTLKKLQLSNEDLFEMQLEAYKWSNAILSNAF